MGNVQDINRDVSQKLPIKIKRCWYRFGVYEVEGNPNVRPTPGMGEEATLLFTLISVRRWGVTDCIAPIVRAPMRSCRSFQRDIVHV